MDIRSTTVSKEVEVVTTVLQDQKVVTLIMSEREAKLLACLIGAMSPSDAEDIIKNKSLYFDSWIGELDDREVVTLTGEIFDGLYDEFIHEFI